jgi:hypothetical protein
VSPRFDVALTVKMDHDESSNEYRGWTDIKYNNDYSNISYNITFNYNLFDGIKQKDSFLFLPH